MADESRLLRRVNIAGRKIKLSISEMLRELLSRREGMLLR